MSAGLTDRVEAAFEKHRHSRHPILYALMSAFSRDIAMVMFVMFLDTGVQILSPICLGRVVRALAGTDVSQMYLWAMALSIVTFL